MKKLLLLIVLAVVMTNVMAQQAGDIRTTASATSLSTATGLEIYDGTNWVAATYAPAGNTLTIKQTSTYSASSTAVTLTSANSLVHVGQSVTAGGLAAGTTVTAVSGTSLTLSQATTGSSGAGPTLSFFETTSSTCTGGTGSTTLTLAGSNSALSVGMYAIGTNITAGTTITALTDATHIVLSAAPTATLTSQSVSFYIPSATATFASGSSTITLKAVNASVTVGMNVYGSNIVAGTKVTSVSGTTIGISIPTTAAQPSAGGIIFGLNVIPNLYINHNVNTASNSRCSSIGNIVINSGGTLNIGIASTTGNDLVCGAMTVNSGGTLGTMNYTGTGQTNTIEINGGENGTCFTNNGTVDLTTTTGGNSVTNLTFTIPGNSSMSGSGTTNLNKLTLNMAGVQLNTLDIQSAFSMLAATTAPTLTLTSGTLKISGASTITPFGGNGSSSLNAIPVIAGLYLNNANATLNWGTATSDGSGMQVRGALTLAAGTLYVKGRFDANGVGVTTITGGTLEIPAGIGFSNATAALFHVGGLHTFVMTGGNLNIKSHNTGAYTNPDYYNLATIQSVTGGTITFSDASVLSAYGSKYYNLAIGAGVALTRGATGSTVLNSLTVGTGSTLENGTNNFLASFAINGNTTSGSNLVPIQSSSSVAVGQYLQGTGIPANTTVTAITQTQTTGIVTSGSASVTGVPTNSGYTTGSLIFGNGIAAGTTVSSISGTGPYTLTLSANASASSTTSEVLIINPVITMSNNATATNSNSQVVFYNSTTFTNSGSGTINIQSTSNPAYPVNTTWASTINMNGSAGSQNFLTGTYTNVIINNTFSTPVVNMQNGGTNLVTGVAFTGASIINGTLTLTNSAFTLNGKSLTLAGSVPTRTSGTISAGSGALVFSNSTPISLPSGIFASNTIGSSLTLNGTGGVTLGDATTVNGALNLTSGILTTGANTLTIGSAGSISGGSATSYVDGNLAMVYAATGSKTFAVGKGGNYRPVTINTTALDVTPSTFTVYQTESAFSGTLPTYTSSSLARNWTIAQSGSTTYAYNLTLTGTGFSPSGTAKILQNNAGSISSYITTGTYTSSGLTSVGSFGLGDYVPPTVPGAPTIGTATAGNAQASVTFTAPASDGGSSIIDYTVTSSPGGLNATGASSPITVSSLTNGTAYTFTVTARNSVGSSSASSASNSITPVSPAVTVSSDANLSSYSPTSATDVTVSAGYELTVNADANVKTITVAPGAKLTLSSGVLTVATTNGITLQNTNSGTASFIDSRADVSTAVAATVEQAITETNRNWYVSVPVSGQTNANITLSGASIVKRNEATVNWETVTGSLTAGVGYIAIASASSGTATWSLAGNLNSGTVTVPVTRLGASSAGFNLLGNPYPSYLNWEQVLNLNATNASLLQPSIWYRTKSGANYAFQTYNSAGRVATPTSTSGYIPPMQAFWVRANGGGNVTFTNAMRSHGNGSSNMLKAPAANNSLVQPLVRLQIANSTGNDETVLYFNANASNTVDNYDTPKMFESVSATKPEIYTQVDTEKLVINGLNAVQYNTEIPVGIVTKQFGDFTISANEMSNFEVGTRIFLIDKLNPTVETELSNGLAYNFTAPITSASTDRFSLKFRAPGVATGIESATKLNVQVFVNANNNIVISASEKSNYAIYNAVGMLIENGKTTAKLQTANCKLQTGVYVVNVNNQTTKVIIN